MAHIEHKGVLWLLVYYKNSSRDLPLMSRIGCDKTVDNLLYHLILLHNYDLAANYKLAAENFDKRLP